MAPESFSTVTLAPRLQFDAWREWYSSIVEVVPQRLVGGAFSGTTLLWRLGGLLISRTVAPPARAVRAKAHLRRDLADHWVISYCVRGAHLQKTADAEIAVPAKVPFLWSLRQELTYERTHSDWVQLYLARDTFRDIAPVLDAACGVALATPLGHLLGDYLLALEQRLPDLPIDDAPALVGAMQAIVAAAVAPSVDRIEVARPQIDVGRMERVRLTVRRHLRSPLLGPKTLSRLVGISRSNLYRLLEERGGVAHYIQRERLMAAHAALSDPANTARIAAIAEELCFADASSFARVFKREFGYSPGEARAAALAGMLLPAAGRSHAQPPGSDFSALLRGC